MDLGGRVDGYTENTKVPSESVVVDAAVQRTLRVRTYVHSSTVHCCTAVGPKR